MVLVALIFFLLGMIWNFSFRKVANVAVAVCSEQTKMVLVVRKDLKMGTGKIAAQCSHAAVAAVDVIEGMRQTNPSHQWVGYLDCWRSTGSAKVVVQCDSEDALRNLMDKAKSEGVPHYLVADAGRTQIAAGSKTVLAIGPAPVSKIDAVSGSLKLL